MRAILILIVMLGSTTSAWADDWRGLRNTAGTLEQLEVVLRLPTGPSAIGVGPSTELTVTPMDISDLSAIGTRLGAKQDLFQSDRFTWSVAPSLLQSWSLGRNELRLQSLHSLTMSRHRLHLDLGLELGVLRRKTMSTDSSKWHVDRVHVPAELGYDFAWSGRTLLRGSLRPMVYDEGRWLTYTHVRAAWVRRWGVFHLALGAGALIGKPSEHVFLGTYDHVLAFAYPQIDLWFQF